MERLILQWHITSRCNQRCTHCYQETFTDNDPTIDQLNSALSQYNDLLESLSSSQSCRVRGHINITGGEPFLHPELFTLLESVGAKYTFGILTNGSLIDKKAAAELSALKPSFVQISIDGDREVHDSIRGSGSFNRTLSSIKTLTEHKIKTYISFTASTVNYRTFPSVAKTAKRLGAAKLWTDRFVAAGGATSEKGYSLTGENILEYFSIVKREMSRRGGSVICMDRSLQFLESGKRPYRCSAGSGIIAVMQNGDVYPCRRLPVLSGNIYKVNLTDIYFNNEIMNDVRRKAAPPPGCSACSYSVMCGGGAKCQAYASTGNYHSADPGCPIPGLYFKD